MSPFQYALLPLRKYAQFQGRARRAEFWWFYLLFIVAIIVAVVLDGVVSGASEGDLFGPFTIIAMLALFVPYLAVAVRRLHDTGRSGWWLLLSLIPLVSIVLLIFFVLKGQQGTNDYGPDPKDDQVDAAIFA